MGANVASTVLKLELLKSFSIRKGSKMSALKEAVKKLRETGTIGLMDLKSLKMDELETLSEDIKHWCLYGNGKPEKLGKKHIEH
jgi:hypothetical protein